MYKKKITMSKKNRDKNDWTEFDDTKFPQRHSFFTISDYTCTCTCLVSIKSYSIHVHIVISG